MDNSTLLGTSGAPHQWESDTFDTCTSPHLPLLPAVTINLELMIESRMMWWAKFGLLSAFGHRKHFRLDSISKSIGCYWVWIFKVLNVQGGRGHKGCFLYCRIYLVRLEKVRVLTFALHSWQRALPWFLMKPRSANSLWHISQQKHSGCQVDPIALNIKQYFTFVFDFFLLSSLQFIFKMFPCDDDSTQGHLFNIYIGRSTVKA